MRAYIIRNKEEQPDGIEIVADTDEDRELLKRAWVDGTMVASYHQGIMRSTCIELFIFPPQEPRQDSDKQ